MNISKAKLETMIKELPDTVDTEEVMYRVYLLQKIETGEAAVREGRTLSHEEVVKQVSRKWRN